MAKQQKGWMTSKEAQQKAAKAHRKDAFRQARKGAGAPEYQEASACLTALLMLPFLLVRAIFRRG